MGWEGAISHHPSSSGDSVHVLVLKETCLLRMAQTAQSRAEMPLTLSLLHVPL